MQVDEADWQKIQELFAKERQWMNSEMQMHIREVNSMFADERKKVRERYKEYDGCYVSIPCRPYCIITNKPKS